MNLSDRQRQYIWLMGSYPSYTMEQGRGKRTARLLYAIDEEAEALVIFGYSNPPEWLVRRGLIKRTQGGTYVLTDEGEAQFRRMLANGGLSSDLFEKVKIKAR